MDASGLEQLQLPFQCRQPHATTCKFARGCCQSKSATCLGIALEAHRSEICSSSTFSPRSVPNLEPDTRKECPPHNFPPNGSRWYNPHSPTNAQDLSQHHAMCPHILGDVRKRRKKTLEVGTPLTSKDHLVWHERRSTGSRGGRRDSTRATRATSTAASNGPSHGKDEKCEDSLLEQDSQNNEMETGAENSNITEWEMVDESCRMEPRTQLKIHQQNMDQHSKRPRKMDLPRRKNTMTSEERQENDARMRMRRNNQSRPARYINEAFGKQQQQSNQELRDG